MFVLMFWVLFAIAGYYIAKANNKEPVFWAVVCLLTGIFGLIVLGILILNDNNKLKVGCILLATLSSCGLYCANLCEGYFNDIDHRIEWRMNQVEYNETKAYCEEIDKANQYKQAHIGRWGE